MGDPSQGGAPAAKQCRVVKGCRWPGQEDPLAAWRRARETGPLVDRGDPSRSSRAPEVPLRVQSATVSIARAVTVAEGVFAPGHLGELTQYLPFELVDDVLAETKTVQRRLRMLPSRAGCVFRPRPGDVPAPWLSAGVGQADRRAGRAGPAVPVGEGAAGVCAAAWGPAPLKALFEVVAGPLAQPHTPGVRFAGLRTVAFDGLNSLKIPDTDRNRSWIGKIRGRMGLAGISDAAADDPGRDRHPRPARRHCRLSVQPGRNRPGPAAAAAAGPGHAGASWTAAFDAGAFFAEITRTGAMLLSRARSTRSPLVLRPPPRRLLPVLPGRRPGRTDHRSRRGGDRRRRHPRR